MYRSRKGPRKTEEYLHVVLSPQKKYFIFPSARMQKMSPRLRRRLTSIVKHNTENVRCFHHVCIKSGEIFLLLLVWFHCPWRTEEMSTANISVSTRSPHYAYSILNLVVLRLICNISGSSARFRVHSGSTAQDCLSREQTAKLSKELVSSREKTACQQGSCNAVHILKRYAMQVIQPKLHLLFVSCLSLAIPVRSRSLHHASRVSLIQETTANLTGEAVLTSSYVRSADAHYLVTGYTVRNESAAVQSRSLQTFGTPFIAKHLLSKERHIWRYAVNVSRVRLSSVVSSTRGDAIFVAGYSEENGADDRPVYKLFLAKIHSRWRGPKLGKVVVGDPVARLKVPKVTTEGKFVFLCGQYVALGNSTLSGSIALMYDTSLNFKWKSQDEKGSGRDFCADISFSSNAARTYQATTKFNSHTGQIEAHGMLDCFDSGTGRKLWSSVLNAKRIAHVIQFERSVSTEKKDSSNVINGTIVVLEKMIAYEESLFVVARKSSTVDKFIPHNVILKVSRDSGLVLWAQEALLSETQKSMEYVRGTAITSASDSYIYAVARYRDAQSYVSFASRLSIFKDFSAQRDVSAPLWRSNSPNSAPVGVFYSNMRGAILAFGQSILISNTTDRNTTYVELPIGPATNTAPDTLCYACVGPQFVRICFELVSANRDLVSTEEAREMIAELFRLFLYHIYPQAGTKQKRNMEESQEYCFRLQGNDIAAIEKNLRKKIRLFITDRDSDGRNALERRFDTPPRILFYSRWQDQSQDKGANGGKKQGRRTYGRGICRRIHAGFDYRRSCGCWCRHSSCHYSSCLWSRAGGTG